jgi:hypothetical protein
MMSCAKSKALTNIKARYYSQACDTAVNGPRAKLPLPVQEPEAPFDD